MFEAEWSQFIDRNFDGPADLARPLALLRLARLGGFRRLHNLVATHLSDWRLRRAHTFQALYTGLSPFDALGIYAVVAHMDTVGGAWFPARAACTPSPWPWPGWPRRPGPACGSDPGRAGRGRAGRGHRGGPGRRRAPRPPAT